MDNVVITGFGPFRCHKLNPSWEAIKEGQLKIDRPNVNVITKQVSVTYEEVDRVVGQLWHEHKPMLMVHVGLAAHECTIRLEQVARHGPYLQDDEASEAPHKHLRPIYEQDEGASPKEVERLCKFDSSRSCLNLERVCEKLNKLHQQQEAPIAYKCSQDAGLYVCEYIYQTSLRHCQRAVFIHVPDVARFKLEDIRLGIKLAIETLLDELNEV